ncbi:VPS10 domain-containing protein [Flavivirga algicola]|uniref:T9SS type A sorting domain-containing protein n=1 Tax=Flavivirga algicola TaxID=2729136 RepID=A0ABX1S348_9FLAO|nr:ricin-type beta-trefoil lectin domain protein [Flavivirga algicola]NMH89675.1 T9SS type A sorting domain-containing protein [Flavivirga algicola]
MIKIKNLLIKNRDIWKIAFSACLLFISSFVSAQTHNWTRTNPGGGGWFGCVGASKSGIVLAGSDLSGAYRSRDGGQTWDVCGASRGFNGTHVSGLGFHRTNGNIMFIAGGGIHKTTNGGDSWQSVLGGGGYITDIEFSTDKPWMGYASRHQGNWNTTNAQIYKTTNTGNSWSQVDTNFPNLRIIKLVVDPTEGNTVYAITGRGRPVCSVADVYKSTDGGVTWQNKTTSNFEGFTEVADMAIDPQNPSTLYLTTVKADCANQFWMDGRDSKLYKSTNGGNSWTKIQDQGGVIFVHPTTSKITIIDPIVVATWNPKSGTRVSTNGGATFTKTSDVGTWGTAFHGETQRTYNSVKDGYGRTVAEDLSNPNNYYWINSQWVNGSKDGGTTFDILHSNEVSPGKWQSTGVDNMVNIDMMISPKNPNIIYFCLGDMGLWRSLDKAQTWENCNTDDSKYGWGNGRGGNGTSVVADPDRENVVWVTIGEGYILKSTNKGERSSWSESNNGIPLNGRINGLSLDVNSPTNNRTMYVVEEGDVYKSTNDGSNWSRVLDNKFCQFTAVDQFDGNLVYAGGTKGLWRSTNGGQNWSRMNNLNDLPADNNDLSIRNQRYKGIYDIDTDPNNPNWVYVTVLGDGENRGLFRSKNKGNTWEKLLTDKYMRKVAIMPKNSNIIYATSSSAMGSGGLRDGSNGVWFSNNGGATWSKQNQGAAYPLFNAVDVSNENNPYVLAGSQGTGFQKANVPVPGGGGGNGISASFVNPSDQQNFSNPASVYVKVNASDANGNISHVKLFLNNTLVRQENVAPYEWNATGQNDPVLKNMSPGNYILKAVATDNSGNTKEIFRPFTVSDGNVGNPIVTIRKSNAIGFAIDGNVGGANGQNVKLWAYDQNNVNQQWEEISRGNGFYSYKKKNTNFCIDGSNGSGNGKNVKLWTCSDTNQNQQFKKLSVGNGLFHLQKRNAIGFAIDGNPGGANNQNVQMWASNTSNQNQQWSFTQVGNTNKQSHKANNPTALSVNPKANDAAVLSVYPNPTNELLNILGLAQGAHTFNVISSAGRLVMSGDIQVNENDTTAALNVNGLSTGIYTLSLGDKKVRFVVK